MPHRLPQLRDDTGESKRDAPERLAATVTAGSVAAAESGAAAPGWAAGGVDANPSWVDDAHPSREIGVRDAADGA